MFDYNHHCFGCGELNPQGLKLKFFKDGETLYTTFVPGEVHQGYPGIMHGGITSTILDEVMSRSISALGLLAFTARLEVRFRSNVPLHRPVRFEAWITGRKSKVIDTEARAVLDDGQVAAEAKARFMVKGAGEIYLDTGSREEKQNDET
ncbi:MAG: PaaI family thioesterase [Peptococcaceae bacterium]|jgi:acyl-coenzyme A thioesterase PaaI-like protein|nr:PaaI family thioesterase [Peptococcaceae bacterium]MDH7524740.1 PaaI family thioesterase [Peptococcaceae bacterium]